MSNRLHIQGEYPADWNEIGDRVRAEADHRCIRCGHRYKTGEHGKGEWTPCDDRCTHVGPLAFSIPRVDSDEPEITVIANDDMRARDALCIAEGRQCGIVAQWRILTVHHLNGFKSDNYWGNLLVLCQRCHLNVQGRVNPSTVYFLEHSAWFKPYAAAHYARKYLNQSPTREEVMARMDELLSLERLA